MDLLPEEDVIFDDNPMDVVEAVIANDTRFEIERYEDGDLIFSTKGAWCEVSGAFCWREELPAVLMSVSYGLQAPEHCRVEAARLTALINENLWFGHFDLWSEDGSVVFRHAIAMMGRGELQPGEAQAMIAAALDAGDRFYPAYERVFVGGFTAEDAARAAIFETIGEA